MQATDPEALKMLTDWIQVLRQSAKTTGQVQDNVRKAASRIFKGRKAHYCLYSWRHQFGGELKASNMPAKTVAYMMGHQSTASIEQYGFKNRARGGLKVKPAGYDPEILKVREKSRSQYLSRSMTFKSENVNEDRGLEM